jgi:hypothetical protein
MYLTGKDPTRPSLFCDYKLIPPQCKRLLTAAVCLQSNLRKHPFGNGLPEAVLQLLPYLA